MRQTLLAAVLALVACGPPIGKGPASKTTVTDPNAADPTSEVVCQDERTTGSNFSRPVCMTREQTDENRRAAQEWETKSKNTPTNTR
jgi:hypothetical protein